MWHLKWRLLRQMYVAREVKLNPRKTREMLRRGTRLAIRQRARPRHQHPGVAEEEAPRQHILAHTRRVQELLSLCGIVPQQRRRARERCRVDGRVHAVALEGPRQVLAAVGELGVESTRRRVVAPLCTAFGIHALQKDTRGPRLARHHDAHGIIRIVLFALAQQVPADALPRRAQVKRRDPGDVARKEPLLHRKRQGVDLREKRFTKSALGQAQTFGIE